MAERPWYMYTPAGEPGQAKRRTARRRSRIVRWVGIAVLAGVVGPIFGLYHGHGSLLLWLVVAWNVGYTLVVSIVVPGLRRTALDSGPTVSPRGTRDACGSIASTNSLGVSEIDAASNNSVDDTRELGRAADGAAGTGMTKTKRRLLRRFLFSWFVGLAVLAVVAEIFGLYAHPVVVVCIAVFWSVYYLLRLGMAYIVPIRRLPGTRHGPTILQWLMLSNSGTWSCLVQGDADGLIKELSLLEGDPDSYSKRAISAYALGILEAKSAVAPLGLLLDPSERWEVRLCAVKALALIDTPEARRAAAPALRDERGETRRAAIDLVGALKSRDMGPALAEIAGGDPEWVTRGNACLQLGRIRDDRWIETLSGVANDDVWGAALDATIGLGHIGTTAAIDALDELVKNGRRLSLRVDARFWRASCRRRAKRGGPRTQDTTTRTRSD